jgi:signal transduction histidine kinase
MAVETARAAPGRGPRDAWLGRLGGLLVAIIGVAALLADSGALAHPSWAWADAGLSAMAGVGFLALAGPTGGALYSGTCARLAARRGWPVWSLRAGVLVLAPALGAGVVIYALVALVSTLREPARRGEAIDWRSATGTGFLGLAFIVAVRAAGLRLGSDAELYSAALIGAGLPVFWSAAGVGPEIHDDGLRTTLGLVLAFGGAGLVLSSTGLFHQAERTIAGTAVALAVLAFVFGPRWLRTSRLLFAERARRERTQERAELADHLHDSVLQTLALIQRRSDDPAEVATLARHQERELRRWLREGPEAGELSASMSGALRLAAAEVEEAERVLIEVVTVGEAPLTPPLGALVAAAREAITNAVRHGAPPVSVFCRIGDAAVTVYVHDRGPGFELEEIPSDRRGVRDSIFGRLDRHGGSATIHVTPEVGCEVLLSLPLR